MLFLSERAALVMRRNNTDAAIRYVASNLRALMKGVQANGTIEEEELDGVVRIDISFRFFFTSLKTI